MAKHSSATAHEETPHVGHTTTTKISKAVRRRAETILNDRLLDAESKALIRLALELNDPWLTELVRRADAGERLSDTLDLPRTSQASDDSSENEVETLTEIICSGGEKASAALLVLMSMLQDSKEPKTLAHTAKQFAFTVCGELNVNGMVDAQVAAFKSELLARNSIVS